MLILSFSDLFLHLSASGKGVLLEIGLFGLLASLLRLRLTNAIHLLMLSLTSLATNLPISFELLVFFPREGHAPNPVAKGQVSKGTGFKMDAPLQGTTFVH